VVAVITAAETITAIVVTGEDSAAVDRAAIHKDRAVRIRAKICSIRVSKMAKSSRRTLDSRESKSKLRPRLRSLRLHMDNMLVASGKCRHNTQLHHTRISGSHLP
jgi:hypothetical protein